MKLFNIMSNNFNKVIIKDTILYFSYETLIGFHKDGTTLIAKNEWSRTTNKHINFIKQEYKDYLEVEHEELIKFANNSF